MIGVGVSVEGVFTQVLPCGQHHQTVDESVAWLQGCFSMFFKHCSVVDMIWLWFQLIDQSQALVCREWLLWIEAGIMRGPLMFIFF